jgi:2-haloacid dehalogenase
MNGPIAGTVEILSEIRDSKKYRLYALTNWSDQTFPWALQNFEFLHWFEGIVVSGHEKTRKPFPEFYQILLDRYQIDPAQSIFIDDVPRNILGAQAVGIPGIHFQSPSQLNLDLQKLGVL